MDHEVDAVHRKSDTWQRVLVTRQRPMSSSRGFTLAIEQANAPEARQRRIDRVMSVMPVNPQMYVERSDG
jgi:hypothetical protein